MGTLGDEIMRWIVCAALAFLAMPASASTVLLPSNGTVTIEGDILHRCFFSSMPLSVLTSLRQYCQTLLTATGSTT
jgi:hypothetical protein